MAAPIKIYYFPGSSFARVAHYGAIATGVPFEQVIVDLLSGAQLQPPFSEILPFGQVPTIDDNGFILAESHAILRYLNQKGNSSLFSADPHTNARIEEALEFIRSAIVPPTGEIVFNRFFAPFRGKPLNEPAALEAEEKLKAALAKFERRFFKESDHVVGTTLTAADVSLITNLQNLRFVKLDLESIAPRVKALETVLKATAEFQQAHTQFDEVVAKLLEGK